MDFSTRPTRYASTFEENEELLAWLKLENVEEVLEPELPICDPHRERHMPLLLLLLRPAAAAPAARLLLLLRPLQAAAPPHRRRLTSGCCPVHVRQQTIYGERFSRRSVYCACRLMGV